VIDHFARIGRKRLADVLVDEKLIPKQQLDEAVGEHQHTGTPLGKILVDSGYLTDWDLAKAVAAHYNLPFLDLTMYEPDAEVILDFPGDLAYTERLLPFDRFGKVLCLACVEMPNIEVLKRIEEITGYTPSLYVCLGVDVARILAQYVPPPEFPEMIRTVPVDQASDDLVIDAGQKEQWERIFDLGNEEVLKED
jgi:MshEN domain